MNCLSFDVGGTTVKYGVIDESYKVLKKDKIPTPENEEKFIYSISEIIKENISNISKVSIAMPGFVNFEKKQYSCLLYTSPSPRDLSTSRMPSSA